MDCGWMKLEFKKKRLKGLGIIFCKDVGFGV